MPTRETRLERTDRTTSPVVRALVVGRSSYPAPLRHIPDPPDQLWQLAPPRWEWGKRVVAAIAVVGARDATGRGLGMARRLGRELAERGITVVSGLALGIDAAAHAGALEAGGTTVAVVGGGVDVVYPRRNHDLRRRILGDGAVYAEWPPGTAPRPGHFPRRNRIISGLCLGVVVVEAAERSGSLATARHALAQGREVFAVPGPALAPRARGPHALLKEGAKLTETVDDIMEEFPDIAQALARVTPVPTGDGTPLGSDAGRSGASWVRDLLLEGADSVADLARRTGRKSAEIAAEITALELTGEVRRDPLGGLSWTGPVPGRRSGGARSRLDSHRYGR